MSFFGNTNQNNSQPQQQQPTFGGFGQPQQQQPGQQSAFGQPNASTPQFGGFGSFGGFSQQPQQQQTQPQQQPQPLFGQPQQPTNPPQSTSTFGGFGTSTPSGFGTSAPSTTSSFGGFGGFGTNTTGPSTATAPSGFGAFGQQPQQPQQPQQQQPQQQTSSVFGQPKPAGFGQSSFGGFGTNQNVFGGTSNSTTNNTAAAPTPSFTFGQPQPSTAQPQQSSFGGFGQSAPPPTSSFSFGTTPSSLGTGAPTTTAPTTSSLFPTPPTTTTQSQPAPPTSFPSLFGNTTAQPTAPSTQAPTTTTTSEPPKPSFSFNLTAPSNTTSTTENKPTENKPSENKAFSFNLPSTTPAAPPVTTNTTPAVTLEKQVKDGEPVNFPSALKGKTLEEIVIGWQEELEEQVNTFNKCAVDLAKWDKDILANEESILALSDRVTQLESWESELEQNLAFIAAQQAELESLLMLIEKELPAVTEAVAPNVMPGGTMSRLSPADADRDRLFTLAESIQSQLNDLTANLTDMITDANNSISHGEDHKKEQVTGVLNQQLETLLWIDRQLDDLKRTKAYTKRLSEKAHIEHERLLFR